jgi:hypothetical protein
LTDATEAGCVDDAVMESTALPIFPSDIALIVGDPILRAVTFPEADTVAIVGSDVAQATVRSVSTFDEASFRIAVACVDCPPAIVGEPSVMATDATADGDVEPDVPGTALTVTGTTAFFPCTLAVMVVLPEASALTSPVLLTLAMDASELFHDGARLFTSAPVTSVIVAVS